MIMNLKRFLLFIAVAWFLPGLGLAKAEPPNFLIIFIDDLGYGDLGCYGGEDARTPHTDQLASDTMMHVVIDASPEYRDRTGKGLHADTLEELDAGTGRLLGVLEELGLRENTLVHFTSDNGPWSNDHRRQHATNEKYVAWTEGPEIPWDSSGPLRGAKGSTWEGGVRVPGILRWPGHVPAGRTSDVIVSTLDILPTFAALAGAGDEVPQDRVIDGVNQRELLLGRRQEGARDRFLYYEGRELQAVRKGPWKLRLPGLKRIRKWPELDRGTQEAELYHLKQDLGETTNLAPEKPEVVERLMAIANELKPS